ncbi:MAG: arsenate reductase (glutaredoxin) [Bacteroidetes bacterium]|nr:arsenate reductase (glutaredoxin) [Bacteroidota bacterium]
MAKLIIYHNPRCSISREACSIIDTKGIPFEIIEYLIAPLNEREIKVLLKKLGMKAEEIVRKKEDLYKTKYKNKKLSETEWVKVLTKNPVLIERPIIVKGDKAVIGRPPENVNSLI